MSRPRKSPRPAAKGLAELGPALSSAAVFFHETLAGKLGLNATDTKCAGFVLRSKGPVTAGDLAAFTGLTTGAVTGIINRLEKARLIERVVGGGDRRVVQLRLRKDAAARLKPLYAPLQKSVAALAASYSAAESAVIRDFMEKAVALMENETERLRGTGDQAHAVFRKI